MEFFFKEILYLNVTRLYKVSFKTICLSKLLLLRFHIMHNDLMIVSTAENPLILIIPRKRKYIAIVLRLHSCGRIFCACYVFVDVPQ